MLSVIFPPADRHRRHVPDVPASVIHSQKQELILSPSARETAGPDYSCNALIYQIITNRSTQSRAPHVENTFKCTQQTIRSWLRFTCLSKIFISVISGIIGGQIGSLLQLMTSRSFIRFLSLASLSLGDAGGEEN